MSTTATQPRPNLQFNTLPAAYDTWLDFYDRLPENLRKEPLLKVTEALSFEEYQQYFGEAPRNGTVVKWEIERDFYLARVAEELLPSRYKKAELATLEQLTRVGSQYSPHGVDSASHFLGRLWKVSLSGD